MATVVPSSSSSSTTSSMSNMIGSLKKIVYTSNNNFLFETNFACWFLLKLFLAGYYGFYLRYIMLGFMGWSFWEYTYHRFIMHGLKNTEYYFQLHGYHHKFPKKLSHIPIFQYILVSPVFFVAAYYGEPGAVFSYSVGHLSGLYCFEKMHWFIHQDENQTQIYTQYHQCHHTNPNVAFCFTTPCVDILCHTFPANKFSYGALALLPIPYVGFFGVRRLYQ